MDLGGENEVIGFKAQYFYSIRRNSKCAVNYFVGEKSCTRTGVLKWSKIVARSPTWSAKNLNREAFELRKRHEQTKTETFD